MVAIEARMIVHAPIQRCFDLSRGVKVHLAANVQYGETVPRVSPELLSPGQRVTWRAKHFGVWQQLTSEMTAMDRPVYFQATMVQGIFRFMQQDHLFRHVNSHETEMRDIFRFSAPLPFFGRIAEIVFLRRYMAKLLRKRNAVIKRIAGSDDWNQYLTS